MKNNNLVLIIFFLFFLIACAGKEYRKVQEIGTIKEYEKFIANHPGSAYAVEASRKIEEIENYEALKKNPSRSAYEEFLKKYPQGKYSPEIKKKYDEIVAYEEIKKQNTPEAFKLFIRENPQSRFLNDARGYLEGFDFNQAKEVNTIEAYLNFINKNSQSKFVAEAKKLIEEVSYEAVKKADNLTDYESFLKRFPQSGFGQMVKIRISELIFEEIRKKDTIPAINDFKEKPVDEFMTGVITINEMIEAYVSLGENYPESSISAKAKDRIEALTVMEKELKKIAFKMLQDSDWQIRKKGVEIMTEFPRIYKLSSKDEEELSRIAEVELNVFTLSFPKGRFFEQIESDQEINRKFKKKLGSDLGDVFVTKAGKASYQLFCGYKGDLGAMVGGQGKKGDVYGVILESYFFLVNSEDRRLVYTFNQQLAAADTEKERKQQDILGEVIDKLSANFSLNVLETLAKYYHRLNDPKGIKLLLKGLKNEEPQIRGRAAILLGELGDFDVIEPLLKLTKDTDPTVSKKAEEGLRLIGGNRKIEPYLMALQDNQAEVREKAGEDLKKIGKPAVAFLTFAYHDEKWSMMRKNILEGLGNIGDPSVINFLISVFKDSDQSLRREAVSSLVKLGNDSLPVLLKRASDKNALTRKYIVESLGRIGDPKAVSVLNKIKNNDRDPEVSKEAGFALERIKRP